MTLEYTQQGDIKDLDPVLDEYMDWFLQVVRRAFFPNNEAPDLQKPASFTAWMKDAEYEKTIETEILLGLGSLHKDLLTAADQLIFETSKFMKAPAYKDFDKLGTFFEEFLNSLRRIARDQGGGAMDPVTGLRSRDMFYRDVGREMDRLARQGKTFCIALIQIDSYDKVAQTAREECQKNVAAAIRKIARSFDDAYHVEEDQFIFSLKQTESTGAKNAILRLNEEITKQNLKFTLSSCISEPLPGDNIRQLLTGMKKDLDNRTEPAAVLEYLEMSPLQLLLKESQT